MAELMLFSWQEDALKKMRNGCILNGGVGSGKSLTSLAYYGSLFGGKYNTGQLNILLDPCDLYIITTARKRDTKEWDKDMKYLGLSSDPNYSMYDNKIIVDSWNNISKYIGVKNSFFIFDEQRVVGYGKWTKSFLEITKYNRWVLLSATPGDCWMDYLPVFLANGFFKNKSDFLRKHVIFSRFTTYPKIDRYINEEYLERLKSNILISMDFDRHTVRRKKDVLVNYDITAYLYVTKNRWNIYKNKPIKNAGEYCLVLRKLVNSDITRRLKILDILAFHPKTIIFYSYDYELDILKTFFESIEYPYSEWNGHKHQPILETEKWVYLVEYVAGCEGWNCISTNCIVFYSLNYSYKVMEQAMGRIDRLNTPFIDLYYYTLKSLAPIDKSICKALQLKKKFNDIKFAPMFKE